MFDIPSLIRQSAIARGIDPDVALRVWQSEGKGGYVGDGGTSFGPFQLHYGSGGRGFNQRGMGNDFTAKTGLHARDENTVPQQIDFALDQAKSGGWGPWYGAKKVGITGMQGIGGTPSGDMKVNASTGMGQRGGFLDIDPNQPRMGAIGAGGEMGGLLGGSGGIDIGQLLLALGSGIAGGSTQGWGAGIGAGLAGAHHSLDNQQNDQLKQFALLQQLMSDKATATHRDRMAGISEDRNSILKDNASKAGVSAGYYRKPDGTQEFVKGGPADPKVIAEQSLARGRGADVPQAVRTDAIKADQAYGNITKALDDYQETVKKTGNTFLPGADKDAVSRKRRNIQLQLKELFNLGVLNGPDLALMDSMLFDPNVSLNPSSGNFGASFDIEGRVTKSVTDLKEILRGIRNSKTKAIGLPDIDAPTATDNDPLGIR